MTLKNIFSTAALLILGLTAYSIQPHSAKTHTAFGFKKTTHFTKQTVFDSQSTDFLLETNNSLMSESSDANEPVVDLLSNTFSYGSGDTDFLPFRQSNSNDEFKQWARTSRKASFTTLLLYTAGGALLGLAGGKGQAGPIMWGAGLGLALGLIVVL